MPALHKQLANLIAREDANAAFQLADDSRRIAEAAGNDSFAMMIIAGMTMLFLPAAFFATVFAMPIMGWGAGTGSADAGAGEGGVMMPQVWLYVEIVVPATLAVLLIAAAFVYWRKRVAAREDLGKKSKLMRHLQWRGGVGSSSINRGRRESRRRDVDDRVGSGATGEKASVNESVSRSSFKPTKERQWLPWVSLGNWRVHRGRKPVDAV